jgi:hypothetical protein
MSTHRLSARLLRFSALAALVLLAEPVVNRLRAQQLLDSGMPVPRLMVISPCGGKAGTSFELTVGGLNLENPEKLIFTTGRQGPGVSGIKAELILTDEPMPKDPKKMPEKKGKKGMAIGTPGIFKYKITLPPDTPLGLHDIRIVTEHGVSNPRTFAVGDLNEVLEKEPNNEDSQAQRIEMNTTVNGSFANSTDVDYYVFAGKKGQRVLLNCQTSSIDGRANPEIEVYDSRDRRVANNRDYDGSDALADLVLPADGDYRVRLIQFTHTFGQPLSLPNAIPNGLSDHFYRLTISTTPWIDAVFPPVVEPGKPTSVTVYGRNLPGGKPDPSALVDRAVLEKITMTVTPPPPTEREKLSFSGHLAPSRAALDGFELRLRNGAGSSNPFLLTFPSAPVIVENDANDTPDKAQSVTLPCEVVGRVDKRRDRDWYSFTAKKGETWNIDVLSHRLGSPTYMNIVLRNAMGGDIYESPLNDPMNQYVRKFFVRSEDPPSYRFTAPADGVYKLLVASRTADVSGGYGPRHFYRLRITRDQPDFHLVALSSAEHLPDTVMVPPGGTGAFTILALREDGFTSDITLTAEGLPSGLTCEPQILSGHVRQTTMVVKAGAGVPSWLGEIKIKGTATVNGTKLVREARPGGVTWPTQNGNNEIARSRLERGLFLTVRGQVPFALAASLEKAEILQGDKGNVKVVQERPWAEFKTALVVSVNFSQNSQGVELPQNLRINNNQPLNLDAAKKDGLLPITVGPDVPPGIYNIVLRGQGQAPYSTDPMAKDKKQVNIVGMSNAVTLTVLPKALATFRVNNTNPTVKVGGQMEVIVSVERKFDYNGEFKVHLTLPPGTKGLSVDDVTIPAGANEAKLVLRAPADAKPGNFGNLSLTAVAMFNGKTPTPHEVKLNVNVAK